MAGTETVTCIVLGTCCCAVWQLLGVPIHAQQQIVDPDFKAVVERPAYAGNGPTVASDEAHSNFHTAAGQYRPLVDLLTSDGYQVIASTRKFETGILTGVDVLIIANANARDFSSPAFTEQECDVVRDWVSNGGSLLLIADHAPFGSSAENLGQRFGVAMGKGWVYDQKTAGSGITTQLIFSRENDQLPGRRRGGRHALGLGRG